jgi:hypothetical protein
MTYQLKEHMQETVNVLHSNPMHRIKSYSEEWMPFDHSPPRWYSGFLPTKKTDLHDIAEILLKVALNTINH